MVAHKSSTIDKQALVAQLTKILKKEFGVAPKRESLPVLETLIQAICLENAHYDAAQIAFDRLRNDFFDWNEVRVSTISELEPTFEGLEQAEWRALRVRFLLLYVFDHQYSFDFDALKKKTLELAHKQLTKIKHLTPFARNYLLLHMLGNHIIPLDDKMCRTAIWLGLLPIGTNEDEGAESLKTVIRKAEATEFMHLLKCLSVLPKANVIFDSEFTNANSDEFELTTALERLDDVMSGKASRRASAAAARQLAATEAKAEAAAEAKAAAAKVKVSKKVAEPEAAVKKVAAKSATKEPVVPKKEVATKKK